LRVKERKGVFKQTISIINSFKPNEKAMDAGLLRIIENFTKRATCLFRFSMLIRTFPDEHADF
jgi:hypothetical protein